MKRMAEASQCTERESNGGWQQKSRKTSQMEIADTHVEKEILFLSYCYPDLEFPYRKLLVSHTNI